MLQFFLGICLLFTEEISSPSGLCHTFSNSALHRRLPAKGRRVSGCSCCRPGLGGPSPWMALAGAVGSSHHTRLGRRRGSDGWSGVGGTLFGTRSSSGCPDLGPSMQAEQHPSPGLDTQDSQRNVPPFPESSSRGTPSSPRGMSMTPITAPSVFCTASPTFLAIRELLSSSETASCTSATKTKES